MNCKNCHSSFEENESIGSEFYLCQDCWEFVGDILDEELQINLHDEKILAEQQAKEEREAEAQLEWEAEQDALAQAEALAAEYEQMMEKTK